MANQIARNLAAQGSAVAVTTVADHIAAFWDPRMKARILAMDGAGLDPIAAGAVALLRERGTPPPTAATRSGGSDAG